MQVRVNLPCPSAAKPPGQYRRSEFLLPLVLVFSLHQGFKMVPRGALRQTCNFSLYRRRTTATSHHSTFFSRAPDSSRGSGLLFSPQNPKKMCGLTCLADALVSFQATLSDATFSSVVYYSSNEEYQAKSNATFRVFHELLSV